MDGMGYCAADRTPPASGVKKLHRAGCGECCIAASISKVHVRGGKVMTKEVSTHRAS
jgi:hypothetical protein